MTKVKKKNVRFRQGDTDYLAVNGPRLARIMRSKKWYLSKDKFGSGVKKLGGFWRMVGFGLQSVIFRVPVKKTQGDVIKFKQPATVVAQVEGESEKLEDVKKIEVTKAKRPLKVIKF